MTLYFVVNARMPNEKAHGIQIAKMCEAFVRAGVRTVLVVPGRGKSTTPLQDFYKLETPVEVVRLGVPDWYTKGTMGFVLSTICFMVAYGWYLTTKADKKRLLYTVDMDTFAHALLPLFGATYAEMHTPKKPTLLARFFFKRARCIIATNSLIAHALAKTFRIPDGRMLIEPNGVDVHAYAALPSREEARKTLKLPSDQKIALYVGRLFDWKGMKILPEATKHLREGFQCYFIGGTEEQLQKHTGTSVDHLTCVGEVASYDIPTWLAAADAGIVLGTKENESSYRYTSPMKLFEYLAAKLPVIASGTPALKDVLTEDDAFFYEPDDVESLAAAISRALSDETEAERRATHAYRMVEDHTWDARATRILATANLAF